MRVILRTERYARGVALVVGTSASLASLDGSTASASPQAKPSVARKSPPPCAVAYQSAVERQESGHLREASALFFSCAKPTCGAETVLKCTAARAQVESEIPTFVPVVVDDTGAPLADIEVKVDGELLPPRAAGRPWPIDPGPHAVTFSVDSGFRGEQKFALVATLNVEIDPDDRGRRIVLSLPAPNSRLAPRGVAARQPVLENPRVSQLPGSESAFPTPRDPPAHLSTTKTGRSWAPYWIGAAGLAALGGGTLLTYWGRNDNAQLAQCSPNCRQGSIDHIQALYIAADVAFGVGIAALGVATVWFATSRTNEQAPPPRSASFGLDVKPTSSGAVASVAGSF